jgi:hypothetical protein
MSINVSTEVESNISELSSSWTKHQLWCAAFCTAVLIAVVLLIATQPQPEAIDYLAGNALPA